MAHNKSNQNCFYFWQYIFDFLTEMLLLQQFKFQQFFRNLKNIFKILFGILKQVLTYLVYGVKILLKFLWQRISILLYNVGYETGILALKLMFSRHLHALER